MNKINKTLLTINDFGLQYASMYEGYFLDVTEDISILFDTPERVGMVSFTGGSDVHPSLYGEPIGTYTGSDLHRDNYEKRIFDKALEHKIPMVGICRGSQFLNVMCGGRMIQDVSGHAGTIHPMRTYLGEIMMVNSTHHQMSVPTDEAKILAYADPKISRYYRDGNDIDRGAPAFETESFYYPKFNVIGWQYHPEMIRNGHWKSPELERCVEFVNDTLMAFIFKNNRSEKTWQA